MRILVVDDDAGSRTIVTRVAAKALRCATDEAANGLEGLEFLERRTYALVVLDLQMPVLGGIETLQAIRQAPALRDIPVVMLTGGASEDQVRQAASLGVVAYLAKPIDPAKLKERLVQVAHETIPGARDAARPGVSIVVVCDSDPDFRRKAAGMLGSEFVVRETDSGVEMLRLLSDEHGAAPHAVLCGPDTGLMQADMLVRHVRQLPAGRDITMCAAMPKDSVCAARGSGLWDGVLSASMPPGLFAAQFSRVVTIAAEARQARELAERPAPVGGVPTPVTEPRGEEEDGVLVIG